MLSHTPSPTPEPVASASGAVMEGLRDLMLIVRNPNWQAVYSPRLGACLAQRFPYGGGVVHVFLSLSS